jgi:hypothetical protein
MEKEAEALALRPWLLRLALLLLLLLLLRWWKAVKGGERHRSSRTFSSAALAFTSTRPKRQT